MKGWVLAFVASCALVGSGAGADTTYPLQVLADMQALGSNACEVSLTLWNNTAPMIDDLSGRFEVSSSYENGIGYYDFQLVEGHSSRNDQTLVATRCQPGEHTQMRLLTVDRCVIDHQDVAADVCATHLGGSYTNADVNTYPLN